MSTTMMLFNFAAAALNVGWFLYLVSDKDTTKPLLIFSACINLPVAAYCVLLALAAA